MGDLSPKEAAEEMGVSRSLVYRLVEQGELDAYQVSNRLRIPREGVERLRMRKRVKPAPEAPTYEPARSRSSGEGGSFAADLRAIRAERAS